MGVGQRYWIKLGDDHWVRDKTQDHLLSVMWMNRHWSVGQIYTVIKCRINSIMCGWSCFCSLSTGSPLSIGTRSELIVNHNTSVKWQPKIHYLVYSQYLPSRCIGAGHACLGLPELLRWISKGQELLPLDLGHCIPRHAHWPSVPSCHQFIS